ncbi:MAG: chemotaxis protein [Oscillospiraceae bacterium]|nr:chemotaxis protein [Oscillospiraceae bacterium]
MSNMFKSSPDSKTDDGTSILELMEFTIAGSVFGINIAKVTEIMQCRPLKPMANSHPCVEGIFKPRSEIVTVINLPKYMNLPEREDSERDMFMLTNFSGMSAAFHVHTVEAMHRIRWSDVDKPDVTIYGGRDSLVTGNAKIGDKMITIVDFEKVLFDINPETGLHLSEVDEPQDFTRRDKPIVIAEDSVFLMKMLTQALEKAGYTNIRSFDNGLDAWNYLESVREDCSTSGSPLETKAAAVITDIEMPQMDGHHFTRLIKGDSFLKKLPVLVFSSLIDEAQKTYGESLGVNAHLSKPQIGSLVSTLDNLVL